MDDWKDRAGREYWERNWLGREAPAAIDPKDRTLDNYMWHRFGQFMHPFLQRCQSNGEVELVEVGCGSSRWLPYFAKEYGFRVSGIDYSETGCSQARAALLKAQIIGEIYEADIFALPHSLQRRFSVVLSFGLVEHFAPTERIIDQLARLGRPGGQIITIIPNMTHIVGWLQKVVDRRVYEVHVPVDLAQLALAHETCGLRVDAACYIGTVNWSVINFSSRADKTWHAAAVRLAAWATKIVWATEIVGMPEFPNRWTSPYIACVASVP
ncbi:MAG: class I SAM-dependent methyltransferase [Acidiferrobacterales bacterium]